MDKELDKTLKALGRKMDRDRRERSSTKVQCKFEHPRPQKEDNRLEQLYIGYLILTALNIASIIIYISFTLLE